MRPLLTTLIPVTLICGLLFFPFAEAAAQSRLPVSFSADFAEMESATGKPTATGKLKAGPLGMRMEGKLETESEPYTMIVNFDERMMWNVIASEQLYFATPFEYPVIGEEDGPRVNVVLPCPGPGARAVRVGSETLQGRISEKWRCESPSGETDIVWFDPRLRVPIREESDDGTIFELLNIREEPLPAHLFRPPPDFMEFESPMMPR